MSERNSWSPCHIHWCKLGPEAPHKACVCICGAQLTNGADGWKEMEEVHRITAADVVVAGATTDPLPSIT